MHTELVFERGLHYRDMLKHDATLRLTRFSCAINGQPSTWPRCYKTQFYIFQLQCRTQGAGGGGAERHVPPEEAMSALKKTHTHKKLFLCTAEKKGGGGTDRAVIPACK